MSRQKFKTFTEFKFYTHTLKFNVRKIEETLFDVYVFRKSHVCFGKEKEVKIRFLLFMWMTSFKIVCS